MADVSKLGECEFFIIAEMRCQLIVHHPYRALLDLQKIFNLSQEESQLPWSIINDHYLTDLPLLYPLHIIAITAVFLSLVLKPTQAGMQTAVGNISSLAGAVQNAKTNASTSGEPNLDTPQGKVQFMVKWLAQSEVDIKAMIECTQEIISLYEVWDQYNEKNCKEQISRFVKARNLDK
jgi:cyclin C